MTGVKGCQDLMDKAGTKLLKLADEIESYNTPESEISENGLSSSFYLLLTSSTFTLYLCLVFITSLPKIVTNPLKFKPVFFQ